MIADSTGNEYHLKSVIVSLARKDDNPEGLLPSDTEQLLQAPVVNREAIWSLLKRVRIAIEERAELASGWEDNLISRVELIMAQVEELVTGLAKAYPVRSKMEILEDMKEKATNKMNQLKKQLTLKL